MTTIHSKAWLRKLPRRYVHFVLAATRHPTLECCHVTSAALPSTIPSCFAHLSVVTCRISCFASCTALSQSLSPALSTCSVQRCVHRLTSLCLWLPVCSLVSLSLSSQVQSESQAIGAPATPIMLFTPDHSLYLSCSHL